MAGSPRTYRVGDGTENRKTKNGCARGCVMREANNGIEAVSKEGRILMRQRTEGNERALAGAQQVIKQTGLIIGRFRLPTRDARQPRPLKT